MKKYLLVDQQNTPFVWLYFSQSIIHLSVCLFNFGFPEEKHLKNGKIRVPSLTVYLGRQYKSASSSPHL